MISISIITISDRCSRKEAEDKSGKYLIEALKKSGFNLGKYVIIPDEEEIIIKNLKEITDNKLSNVIITTGGTGISPRDVTPEATKKVIEKELYGISEYIRAESAKKNKKSLLSRMVSGVRGECLIINFPGSLNAVKECFDLISDIIPHAIDMIAGKGH